ncbi:MAG: Lrp/AsnC family transcriptional regulator [Candidatus Woesearchaeota archaeon]
MELSRKDILLLSHLRENSRETLTRMSRKTGVPVSTLYDRLNYHNGKLIKRFTSLIDFRILGYMIRVHMLVKVSHDSKEKMKEFLKRAYNANSVVSLNNDFDFLIDGIFKDMAELENFKEKLYSQANVERFKSFFVVDEVKSESFMAGHDAGMSYNAK